MEKALWGNIQYARVSSCMQSLQRCLSLSLSSLECSSNAHTYFTLPPCLCLCESPLWDNSFGVGEPVLLQHFDGFVCVGVRVLLLLYIPTNYNYKTTAGSVLLCCQNWLWTESERQRELNRQEKFSCLLLHFTSHISVSENVKKPTKGGKVCPLTMVLECW